MQHSVSLSDKNVLISGHYCAKLAQEAVAAVHKELAIELIELTYAAFSSAGGSPDDEVDNLDARRGFHMEGLSA